MGMSIYPQFEREVRGLTLVFVQGKDLSRAVELNVELFAPLLQFSSITAAQLEELRAMEEGWEEMTDEPFPTVKWFEAAAGSSAVQQILNALRSDRNLLHYAGDDPDFTNWVIEDLEAIAQNLSQAVAHEIRFHLAGNF